ncbi:YojF family protein [Bacillus sp. 165]|uniref:YojF family protein n=1 Tax=Bacillus sp. 165 TaxID=1529117 RepID=UPI001ADB44D6|nr:YojF family protein [Bacillus sp. 165]MBO9129152.1 YojF family protein [Bacillus sp. 165]
MKPINPEAVQRELEQLVNQQLYLHLETTNGAYASHFDAKAMTVGAFIRNAQIEMERGTIAGNGPYRVGLKMQLGWVYAEGLTHWEVDEKGRLLMAGHDGQGRLAVALQLSKIPF